MPEFKPCATSASHSWKHCTPTSMMRIVLLHRALRLAMQSPLRPQARHLHSTVATKTTPTTSGTRHRTALLAGAATRPHRGSTALDCTVGTTTTSTVHGRAQIVFGRTWKTTMMMRGTALKRMSKAIAHSASPKCIVGAKHRIAPAAPHGPTHALQAAPSPQFLLPTRSRALHRHGHGSQPAMAIHRKAPHGLKPVRKSSRKSVGRTVKMALHGPCLSTAAPGVTAAQRAAKSRPAHMGIRPAKSSWSCPGAEIFTPRTAVPNANSTVSSSAQHCPCTALL